MSISSRVVIASALLGLLPLPYRAAAQQVDKTGLDILCSGSGDTYVPPKNGLSACIFADGTIMVCDSKTDKCTRSIAEGDDKRPHLDAALTARLLKVVKLLSDRLDRVESQLKKK